MNNLFIYLFFLIFSIEDTNQTNLFTEKLKLLNSSIRHSSKFRSFLNPNGNFYINLNKI